MAETYPINIWINEDRFDKLQKAGLERLTVEMLAGLKVLRVPTNDRQRDEILRIFPMAKYDSATTKSIELLPKDVKDKIFDMIVSKKSLEIMDDFIKSVKK
jgi:glutathionyl-hydroquinone reductase